MKIYKILVNNEVIAEINNEYEADRFCENLQCTYKVQEEEKDETFYYESVYIINPYISLLGLDEIMEKIYKIFNDNKIIKIKEEKWGIKKLAYSIKNSDYGYYITIDFKITTKNNKMSEEKIAKLTKYLKNNESILKFIIMKARYKK